MPFEIWSRPSRRNSAPLAPSQKQRRKRRAGLAGKRIERLENRYALAAQLTTTPLTWEVLGIDSNKPVISGPNQFLIGARITNTGTEAVSGVTASMNLGNTVKLNALNQWATQTTTFITPAGPTTSTAYNLAPGQSVDVYFGVQIARDTKAYNTARRYNITATGTATSGSVSDSLDGTRQLFVEKLVSQNRNATQTITITKGGAPVTIAQRGDILTITHTSKSAPGGYEQMVNELTLSNSAFEIIGTPVTLPAILPTGPSSITPGVSTTFSTDGTTREGSANTKFYMDAAGWRSDPGVFALNPTYRTPTDSQKAGGTSMVTTYQVKVRDAAAFGSYNLTGIIYDYSGSSYHYNSDYGAVGKVLTITDAVVVGDRVWKDNNGNGRQDSVDLGIPGVTVELRRASDNALISTTITDVNGNYYFDTADGLTLDTSYFIKFVKPAGTTFVTKNASAAAPDTDSDADITTGQTAPFTLTAAASQNLTIDAGLSFTGNTISGSVWVDTNGNGLQDSGEAAGAAIVQLYQIVDGQPVLITSATTTTSGGGAGAYSFTNLPPGDYFIKTIPVSETQGLTNADQGANDAIDSDFNPFTGDTAVFTLGTGQTVDRDAGLVTGATITGTIWN
ncbi:MAG: hypothetical protein LW698_05095, partial [Planctomycetaceae bacterium]|nr:hypothetical protein [Planctomycetaceae bacterium]